MRWSAGSSATRCKTRSLLCSLLTSTTCQPLLLCPRHALPPSTTTTSTPPPHRPQPLRATRPRRGASVQTLSSSSSPPVGLPTSPFVVFPYTVPLSSSPPISLSLSLSLFLSLSVPLRPPSPSIYCSPFYPHVLPRPLSLIARCAPSSRYHVRSSFAPLALSTSQNLLRCVTSAPPPPLPHRHHCDHHPSAAFPLCPIPAPTTTLSFSLFRPGAALPHDHHLPPLRIRSDPPPLLPVLQRPDLPLLSSRLSRSFFPRRQSLSLSRSLSLPFPLPTPAPA